MIQHLRDEALLLLEGRGAILDVARHITRVMDAAGMDGAVIGGVAVVLHNYVRTTVGVDLFVPGSLEDVSSALRAAGYRFDAKRREFRKQRVPVHLVSSQQVTTPPRGSVVIEGVRTVRLADLLNMKLESGLRDPLRAIDLADVIGLIRAHRLTPTFAGCLSRGLRVEFRKLARAVAKGD